jgi:hypothetical protein
VFRSFSKIEIQLKQMRLHIFDYKIHNLSLISNCNYYYEDTFNRNQKLNQNNNKIKKRGYFYIII